MLDHSWKIENEILLSRLDSYKKVLGYKDISAVERIKLMELEKDKKKRDVRTPSEEARRLEAFSRNEAEMRRIKEEARGNKTRSHYNRT